MLLSLPRLTNNENTPEDVFTLAISHLTLSADPVCKAPFAISATPVFIITPSESVSNIKGDNPEVGPPEPVSINELVASLNEPDVTRVTNNDSPPCEK